MKYTEFHDTPDTVSEKVSRNGKYDTKIDGFDIPTASLKFFHHVIVEVLSNVGRTARALASIKQ